jgi:putative FmdB family regulatory protein
MPIYVYKPIGSEMCDHCEGGFEQLQRLSDDPLEACPECGALLEQVLTAANLASSSPSLDEKNIEKHGFTQYRKLEKGVYGKTAGKGPEILSGKDTD